MFLISKFIIFLLILVASFNISPQVLAGNPAISEQELRTLGFKEYETINPNRLIYPLKRFYETLKLFPVKDPQKKAELSAQLLDSRINELVYIANFKKTGFLEETTGRYNALANKLIVLEYNKINPNFKKTAQTHILILEKIRDIYPANSEPWIIIQYTIDTVKKLN